MRDGMGDIIRRDGKHVQRERVIEREKNKYGKFR